MNRKLFYERAPHSSGRLVIDRTIREIRRKNENGGRDSLEAIVVELVVA